MHISKQDANINFKTSNATMNMLISHRIKNIQKILDEEKCDAFMLITGVDSRFNDGAYEAANYLFFDVFKDDQKSRRIPSSKHDPEIYEDMMLCVKKQEALVYCNPINYTLLLPFISKIPNLKLFCVPTHDMNDAEAHENYKMSIFRLMFAPCKRIAICFRNSHAVPNRFEKMMVETWPIVQSYAFDVQQQCSHEFFTLSHEIIDVSAQVHRLLKRIDPVQIEKNLIRSLLNFTGAFESVYRLVDSLMESQSLSPKVNPFEPLLGIYQPSIVDASLCSEKLLPPYMLYGQNSKKANIESNDEHLKTFEFPNLTESIHAVIRGYSQTFGLVCERTNFFPVPNERIAERVQNMNRLKAIYQSLVLSIQSLIFAIEHSPTVSLDKLLSKAQESLFFQLRSENYASFEIKLTYPWKNPGDVVKLVIVSGAVYDIQGSGKAPLGSVVYADTLLISSLCVNKELKSRKVTNLTSSIQPVCLWTIPSALENVAGSLLGINTPKTNEPMELDFILGSSLQTQRAKIVITGKQCVLYGQRIGLCYITAERVRYYRSVEGGDFEALEIVTSRSIAEEDITSLPIKLAFLPSNDMVEDGTEQTGLWFLIRPRTKGRRIFIEHVASLWRSLGLFEEATSPAIEPVLKLVRDTAVIEGERANMRKAHTNQEIFFQTSLNQLMTDQPSDQAWIQIHRSELAHIEASWCLDAEVTEIQSSGDYLMKCGFKLGRHFEWLDGSEQMSLTKATKDFQIRDDPSGMDSTERMMQNTLVLTVLCGNVGSRKEIVGQSLMRLAQDRIQWIEITANTVEELPEALLKSMRKFSTLTETCKDKRIHGLLVCPENVGSKEVLQVLSELESTHKGGSDACSVKIGCVATCVDLRTAVIDSGRMPSPGLLDMVAKGWTNYLIYTGPQKSQVAANKLGVPMEDVEQLLHASNPGLTPWSAPDGHLDQDTLLDALLDEHAFDEPMMQRARLLSYANLAYNPHEPRMYPVTLRFTRPLERTRFVNALKGLFSHLKPWPYYGNVYSIEGQVSFVGEPGKVFDVLHITLSGVSRISRNTEAKTPNDDAKLYWLTGVIAAPTQMDQQREDRIKREFSDWLRKAGQQQENPREPISRKDLTDQVLEKIHEKYHLHALPPGWYYTGDHYVNMNGEKSYKHPNFDEFVAEYLEGENTKIAARNARIASHPVPDLFGDS